MKDDWPSRRFVCDGPSIGHLVGNALGECNAAPSPVEGCCELPCQILKVPVPFHLDCRRVTERFEFAQQSVLALDPRLNLCAVRFDRLGERCQWNLGPQTFHTRLNSVL